MATAVAASPSDDAGQPVDEQTSQPGGAESGGVEGAPGEVSKPEPKPRERKTKLPGVVTKDDGEDIFPELGFKSRTGKRIGRREAQAEADRELREEMGLEFPEPPEGEQPKEEAPAPKKIKFGDKEYNDLSEAEQNYKSLQGMFKPLNERVTKAEALARDAAESARLWRQRAMEYEEGKVPVPAQQQQVQQQPTTPQSAEQELQAVLQNVDGEMFETLARERGLPLAGRYLAAQVLASVHDQMLPALRESILQEIMPQLQPVVQSAEFNEAVNTTASLLDSASQLRNPDGQIAFPELDNEAEMTEIAELWETQPNAAPTIQSLIQAIAMYRLYRGARGSNQPSVPPIEVSAPQTTMPRSQSLEAGGSSARPTAPRAGAANSDDRFARMLDDAHLVDPILGFSVRRRPSR